MHTLTRSSIILSRNYNIFTARHVFFAGDLQDSLPGFLKTAQSYAHTQQYHHWQTLKPFFNKRIYYNLITTTEMLKYCDTLVYYWTKNKREANFQLKNILSLLPIGSDIFIVGENRSGVRGAKKMMQNYLNLKKIDSRCRCSLYQGTLQLNPSFNENSFWNQYQIGSIILKSFPGVFGFSGLDAGSQLLISTFKNNMHGKVLDIGCGTGVISAFLLSISPQVDLTLTDIHAAAIASSKATLLANCFPGKVYSSNLYSNVYDRFHMIISNPPFHSGLKTNLDIAYKLIQDAPKFLYRNGELRIVANSFLPYPKILDDTFGNHQIIVNNQSFKVYRSIKI
ncbi:16S rRNA (guanine(1207)-N(2))-methyltransferase RsmC [Candidatus Erwinia haradaeae]|uniref:Ribosomal RNA small subunit methyltransferase C n=1 Tax=Candidatus Erwinia haradaeae TaxID=1922217 RepID=A0A803FTG5_9GAMM|nr:16S rRNA (guanine(1207)-N(2))-methyltransferase RsmC [Candidatus Erwinia haradaeae]VFP87958.1 Ribosomal RNA small subunit methyltransferase C [Candidatus Erwinia haradaeae]